MHGWSMFVRIFTADRIGIYMGKGRKTEVSTEPKNKKEAVDLSALDGFDFGTNWSSSTAPSESPRSKDRRSPRGDREKRFSGGKVERKDRRGFKPSNYKQEGLKDTRSGQERLRRQSSGHGSRQGGRPEIPRKVVEVSFYPEDNGFKALCKALKASTITYELFDIARTILEKDERFYVIIRRDTDSKDSEQIDENLYVAGSGNLPFIDEGDAKRYALSHCLENFFTTETKEVEPPSGSFSSIQKCGFTGELLGPPNYHKIKKIMEDHHSSRLSNMSYSKFESRLESAKGEEIIAEWLEKMKTQTTFTLKPNLGEPRTFEDCLTARSFVSATLADKLVKAVPSVGLKGSEIGKIKDSLIKANIEFSWERQKRFPLDTANHLRGRFRRQRFSLYKKGAKGASLVCAVKRRFREPDNVFSETVQKLIELLEANPKISVRELSEKYLGLPTHATEKETSEFSEDQQKQLKSLKMDFQWLLKEGYIAEYSDGSVLLHPVIQPDSEKSNEKSSKGKAIENAMEDAGSVTLSKEDNQKLQKKAKVELSAEESAASARNQGPRKSKKKSKTVEDPMKKATAITLSDDENIELANQAESEIEESLDAVTQAQASSEDAVNENCTKSR